ncbi:MAG: hypothetical protein JRJ84_11620 [Deltaproteobacteria bacterium]|nr:hypothetical protein [Deltaproteobacteria bacterium]
MDRALAIHIPPHGLATVGDAVEALAPTSFPILYTVDTFECSEDTGFLYALEETEILFSTDEVLVETTNSRVEITLYGTLNSTPTTLGIYGSCGVLEGLWESCGIQIPTTAVEVHLGVALVSLGGQVLAVADPVDVQISPITNPISDCTLASAAGTLLGQNPDAINDLLSEAIGPALEDVPAEMEQAIEDALNSFAVETTIDLIGTPLGLSLNPVLIEISSAGMIVAMDASVNVLASDCVDPSVVPLPDPQWPVFGDVAPDTSLHYDAGVYMGRGFVDELLTAFWASGVLCMEIDQLGDVPLQGGLVGAFFGEEVGALLGADDPAVLVLGGDLPPTSTFERDQPAIRVGMPGLTLDLVTELDHRQTRILQVGVDAEIGLDVGLVDNTIAPTLVIDEEGFLFSETYSEMVGPGYSANLGGLLDLVLAIAVPTDALTEITIPELLGIQIDEVFWVPTDDGEWHGAFALADLSGVEAIEVSGCTVDGLGCDGGGFEFDLEETLGCDDPAMGCGEEGSACVHGKVQLPSWRWLPVLFLVVVVPLRRRTTA